MKLELQRPMPAVARLAAKAMVLLAGWLIAGSAGTGGDRALESYGGSSVSRLRS